MTHHCLKCGRPMTVVLCTATEVIWRCNHEPCPRYALLAAVGEFFGDRIKEITDKFDKENG